MFDPVGRLLAAKYRITQRLGGGGVADVYEAVHEEIGQRFAIKILKPEFAAFPEVAERFLVEARAAAAVRHPGVVKIFDFGRLDEGMPYLVMELLDGESLADLLERRRRLPQDQAIGLCLHVLDALEAAHRAGIVHRDLKPENVVLVRGPGGEPWAKLIDFGIALLGHTGPAAIRQTVQGTVMGTPYYMAPEQARGALDIDGRADLYALGVMLYEMLVGKLPFTGRTPAEVLTRALTEPFPSARAADPSIPEALDDVLRRATARRRDQRFASAAEFADALRRLRPEMVAVEFVAEEEAVPDAEGTAIRRLAELARRPESWRAPGMTPPRISGPPPLPGRPGGTHTPRSTPPLQPRPSLTPLPIRPQKTSVTPPPHAVVVSRWAVFLGATLGIVAVAAGAAALLVVLADRAQPGIIDGGVDVMMGTGGESTPGLEQVADRAAPDARGAPRVVPVPVAAPLAVPAPPAAEPAAATPAAASPEPAPGALRAVVRLQGLPPGARATLDGRPVAAEFALEPSETAHTLRVVLRGHRPFVHRFRATGDLVIPVRLQPTRNGAPPDGDAETERPAVGDPGSSPRPLANPFGEGR